MAIDAARPAKLRAMNVCCVLKENGHLPSSEHIRGTSCTISRINSPKAERNHASSRRILQVSLPQLGVSIYTYCK